MLSFPLNHYIITGNKVNKQCMTSFGRIEELLPKKETISNYAPQARGDIFQANGIDDEKKVPVFLSITEGNIYALLHSLLSPTKPQNKTELEAKLKKHFEPKKNYH